MITPTDAFLLLTELPVPTGSQKIALEDSIGRILAEDICADRDFPPFNRVMMDGIAVHDIQVTEWPLAGIAYAGEPEFNLPDSSAAVEIMTGAMLPANSQAVIKIEELEFFQQEEKPWVRYIGTTTIEKGQFIHQQGSDAPASQIIMAKGKKMGPVDVAIAASVGLADIQVSALPSIGIISTGDEIIPIDQQPLAFQIRSSNSIMIESVLRHKGFETTKRHVLDNPSSMEKELAKLLEKQDILILTGGVSAGKKDFIPAVLTSLGFEVILHKIAQKPGKPLWVGKRSDGKIAFALPGNPISTLTCFWVYFLPWINQVSWPTNTISVSQLPKSNSNLVQWIPISMNSTGAQALRNNGSGDLINWASASAIACLPIDHQGNELVYFPLNS
jgi:molybdopterin molybdotransferase